MRFIDNLLFKFGFINKSSIKKYILPTVKQIPETYQSEKTYAQLVTAYKSWVYTCIDKISKSIAMMPVKLVVYRNSTGQKINAGYQIKSELAQIPKELQAGWLTKQNITKIELEDHPYLDLIKRPNSIMTRFMLWYETMTRLELGGLCGWYLVRDGLRVPREIWPLPLTQYAELQPKVTPDLQIEYWLYRDGDVQTKFDPDDIVIFKYPNPKSPFDWFSPLMAQMYPYDIDFYLQQQQANYYKNGVMPSMIAETDQDLGKEQVDEILEQISADYGTPTKSGKVMLLHSGLKKSEGLTPKDALLDKVTKYAREKLITSYDLSEGKLGLVSDVNRANMEALDKSYTEDCLMPKTMLLEETIEAFMLPVYDQGLLLDFVLPENTDKEFNLKEADMELKNFAINVNEYRNKKGMEPVAWGDVPWGSFNNMHLSWGSNTAKEKPEKEPNEDKSMDILTKNMKPISEWSAKEKRQAWMRKNAFRNRWFHLFESNIKAFFAAQKERILNSYDAYTSDKVKGLDLTYQTKAMKPNDIGFSKKAEEEALKEFFYNFYLKMTETGANEVLQGFGMTASFSIDKTAEKYLTDRLMMFSKEVTGTTFDDIKKVLTAGYDEGLPYLDIRTELRKTFNVYEQYRAQLITRTESNSAMNKAEKLAIKQQGIDPYLLKHWLTSGAETTRETHHEAEKRYEKGIPIDEDFIVGDDTMDMPGNGSLAEENVNCLCTVVYSRSDKKL